MPWVLTSAGSTFLLSPNDGGDGLKKIEDALIFGLKPEKSLPEDWRKMPYLSENGYGRIACNLLEKFDLVNGVQL